MNEFLHTSICSDKNKTESKEKISPEVNLNRPPQVPAKYAKERIDTSNIKIQKDGSPNELICPKCT